MAEKIDCHEHSQSSASIHETVQRHSPVQLPILSPDTKMDLKVDPDPDCHTSDGGSMDDITGCSGRDTCPHRNLWADDSGSNEVTEPPDIIKQSSTQNQIPSSTATAHLSAQNGSTRHWQQSSALNENQPDLEASSQDDENMSTDDLEGSYLHDDLSPEPLCASSPGPGGIGRVYKCRFCSFSSVTYNHLQLHMAKHTGHKALRCSLCDYHTNDKSNFRRHKRLHVRTTPATVLHCDKCDYSTVLTRKMREHYSHAHNEDYGPSLISSSRMHLQSASFGSGHYNGLTQRPRLCSPVTASSAGTLQMTGSNNNFHSFLTHPNNSVQFARGNPPHLVASCASGGFSAGGAVTGVGNNQFDDGRGILLREDNRVAANHLHTIVSSIMGHPRVPATATITSSNLYVPISTATQLSCRISPVISHPVLHQNQHLHQRQQGARCAPMHIHHSEQVKVKIEPLDRDGVSDVSSSGANIVCDREQQESEQDRPHRYLEPQTTVTSHHRLSSESLVSHNNNCLTHRDDFAPSSEIYRVSQSSETALRQIGRRDQGDENYRCGRYGSGVNVGLRSNLPVKSEMSSVGVQCSFSVKNESSSTLTVPSREHVGDWRPVRYLVIERGVQCELLSSTSPQQLTSRSLSGDSDRQSVSGSDTRCSHCGITFDDDVLFSIHIGCHSHTDPFVCNVCGKKCYNKYGFYSHIMRGHNF